MGTIPLFSQIISNPCRTSCSLPFQLSPLLNSILHSRSSCLYVPNPVLFLNIQHTSFNGTPYCPWFVFFFVMDQVCYPYLIHCTLIKYSAFQFLWIYFKARTCFLWIEFHLTNLTNRLNQMTCILPCIFVQTTNCNKIIL